MAINSATKKTQVIGKTGLVILLSIALIVSVATIVLILTESNKNTSNLREATIGLRDQLNKVTEQKVELSTLNDKLGNAVIADHSADYNKLTKYYCGVDPAPPKLSFAEQLNYRNDTTEGKKYGDCLDTYRVRFIEEYADGTLSIPTYRQNSPIFTDVCGPLPSRNLPTEQLNQELDKFEKCSADYDKKYAL